MSRPAQLWKALPRDQVQCVLCSHFCHLQPGERGQCGVRENICGELHTLVYDKIAALHLDPVEKKPLFHFLPGSTTLSLGTPGCNFHCTFCQNAHLSQVQATGAPIPGQAIEPAQLVAEALRVQARSLSYTYSEPTVFFELMMDTAIQAQEKGLANILVSNGFQSLQCLQQLGPLIQAANIDLKAFSNAFYERLCGARLGPVLDNLVHMRTLGWHLELTTLLIPGLNDSDQELTEIASFISTHLGADTPWHISRFYPCYQAQNIPPTPVAALERACAIGKNLGLHFVYGGNIPNAGLEDTICPGCGATVIERRGFQVHNTHLATGACQTCGQRIYVTTIGQNKEGTAKNTRVSSAQAVQSPGGQPPENEDMRPELEEKAPQPNH